MSWEITSSAGILDYAGTSVNSTASASAGLMTRLSDNAQAYVNTVTRADWVTPFSTLSTELKNSITAAMNMKAAMWLIDYDLFSYNSRAESQTMLNVLTDDFNNLIGELKEIGIKKKVGLV